MIIIKSGLLDLLTAQVQYRIPIYQRKYDWDKNNCIKFLDDIVSVSNDNIRNQHFVGSIIYKSELGVQTVGHVNTYFLIDGQQRLTTLMLILWALGHYAQEVIPQDEYLNSYYRLDAIKELYLTNRLFFNTDSYYRLKPIGNDEIAFNALLNDEGIPAQIGSSKIFDNYQIILSRLRSYKISPEDIFTGIKKLVIANISLEINDNAQLLFETVNSTGKALNEADKVRNFILMNAGEDLQQQLYNNHWQPMEQRLNAQLDGEKTLEKFFKYYAGIITEGKIPDNYYEIFKDEYLEITAAGIQRSVNDMDAYSVIYKRWLDCNSISNGIDKFLYRLKSTNVEKCIPVVLKVLRNVDLEVMSENDAIEVMKLIESYIIRREMYGLKTNAIGEAFVKILKSSDSLLNIKRCMALDLTEKQRMPKDNELKTALQTVDFYNLVHSNEILDRIEKHLNPAYMPDHEHVSIEHIMPQSIESHDELFARNNYTIQEKIDRDWATDLGENWKDIHEKYVNTLGNLTLTGYNSYLSNCRFIVKRDMRALADNGVIYGYSTSAIRLSHGLRNLTQWGETEILNRVNDLFSNIQALWPYPSVPSDELIVANTENIYNDESPTTKQQVVDLLFCSPDYLEVRRNSIYMKVDGTEGDMILVSKMYQTGNEEQYWFALRENAIALLDSCGERFCLFVCRSNALIILKLNISFLEELKGRFNCTKDNNGSISYYHIKIRKNLNGRMYLLLSGSRSERIDITSYIVEMN